MRFWYPGLKAEYADEDPIAELAGLYRLGEGRLTLLNYPPPTQVVCVTATPTARGDHPDLEYEYLQPFAIKAILWTAGRVPGVLIGSVAVEPDPIGWQQQDKALLHLELENQLETLPVEIQWVLRDDMGPPLASGSLASSLKKGHNSFSIPLPPLPAASTWPT